MPKKLKRTVFISMLILISLASCKKNLKNAQGQDVPCELEPQDCDSCLFYLSNKTNDTVWFGLQTNMLEDTLLPGETRVFKYGRVKVTIDANTCERKRASWSTGQMTSSCGEWAYNLDHCQKKSNFEYTSNHAIQLVDATDY